jgi:serine/threonine-protein kinase
MPDWKLCEGEFADGKFPLERYLGGSEGSAVFLTRFASGAAAIKLVPADQAQSPKLVERWNRTATLNQPHLIRILATGTCTLAGAPLAYLVMEYAGEHLAAVLRERPLTTAEAREMLLPVADTLAYLHGEGLVHGNLKPSNILAVEDTVKISSESVSAGDPAADIRALGVTLVQALTPEAATVAQGGPEAAVGALPFPFRELAHNCLNHDPRLRWSAARIGAWLRSPQQPASTLPASAAPTAEPARGKPRPRYYVAVLTLVVVGLLIAGGLVMHRTAAPVPSVAGPVRPAPSSATAPAPPNPSPPDPSPTVQTPAPSAAPPAEPASPPAEPAPQDATTRRVLPDIPPKARNTIHGKATVVVKVAVDSSGHVTEATLEPGGSPYFGKLALAAARHWEFRPVEAAAPRNWTLRFEIRQTATQVIVRKGSP